MGVRQGEGQGDGGEYEPPGARHQGAAFLGAEGWTTGLVITVLFTQWGLKVAWEVILTPVTYAIVGWLKRKEGIDVYDERTDFTPFRAKV